jgi:threonine dehydrogenase-like Zn-dependent dehydrogenase
MDRPTVARQAIQAAAKGGRVSPIGVYGGVIDTLPIGAFFGRGLTMCGGQCDVQQFMPDLLQRVLSGDFDMTSLISHRLTLDDAPYGYEIISDKKDHRTKIVMRP